MSNLVSLLKKSINGNEQLIEKQRSETLNKVNKICNSAEMKKVLKDTGFLIEDRGTIEEYMNSQYNRILCSKFKSISGLRFEIDYHYGDYQSSVKQHSITNFEIGELGTDIGLRGEFQMCWNNKEEDFQKLTKWYSEVDKYIQLITSTPIQNLLSVLNEYVVDYNNLLSEINEYNKNIETLEEKELEDTINDLLVYGGELELGVHKVFDWDYDRDGEKVYSLYDTRNTIGLDYRDILGVKEWDSISKIKVLNKVKGKQSWEVELYRHIDINTFEEINTAILTKGKLSGLIENMINDNKRNEVRTQNSIEYYNEKTSEQLVK